MSATSSQRISFTQLVLDLGLADKKALLKAKKLIKERQADGQKLTIARACVELGVLTEKQAKKVQLELKRLKTGLASSNEFVEEPSEAEAAKVAEDRERDDDSTRVEPIKEEAEEKAERTTAKRKKLAEPEEEAKSEEPEAKAEPASEAVEEEAKAEPASEETEAKAEPASESVEEEAKAEPASEEAEEAKAEPASESAKAEPASESVEEEAKAEPASESVEEAKAEPASESVEEEAKAEPASESAEATTIVEKKKKPEELPEDELEIEEESAEEAETKVEAKKKAVEKPAKVEKKPSAEQKALPQKKPSAEKNKALPQKKPSAEKNKVLEKKKAEPESESTSEAAPVVKGKAKLGAEIKLDSAAKKASALNKAVPRGKRRAAPGEETEEKGAKRQSQAPLLALGGLVAVVLMGSAAFVALREKKPSNQTANASKSDPTPDSVPTIEPDAEPDPSEKTDKAPDKGGKGSDKDTPAGRRRAATAKWESIGVAAMDLADTGKFKEALAKLEEFPEDLRDQDVWKNEAQAQLTTWKGYLPLQEQFEAALASAGSGDKKPLRAWVKKLEGKGEHVAKTFAEAFRKQARAALGDESYEKILTKLDTERAQETFGEVGKEGATDGHVEIPAYQAPEIKLRGSEERRKKFQENKATAEKNLAAAKKVLAERQAAKKKKVEAEADRVIKATKKSAIRWDGKEVKVTAYDENGFSAKVGKDDKTFTWNAAPAELGPQVKFLAIDTSDGKAIYDLGVYSLSKGQFDLAKKHFEAAAGKDASLKDRIPDVEQFRPLFETFRGKTTPRLDGDHAEVQWKFESGRPSEKLDFKALAGGMEVEQVAGQLQISTAMPAFRITAANVHGDWRGKPEIHVTVGSSSPTPFVGISAGGDLYMVQLGQKVELRRWGGDKNAAPIAGSEVRAQAGSKVVVKTEIEGEKLKVAVKVDDRECFTHVLEWDADQAVGWMLGAEGHGRVLFDDIACAGKLDDKWLKRAKKAGPSEVARVLGKMEADIAAKAAGAAASRVSASMSKCSAEDEVGMNGISSGVVALVEEARTLLAQGNFGIAIDKLKEASNKSPDYAAAHYLYAEMCYRSDRFGGREIALFKLEQSLQGIEDFYEAWATKGKVLVYSGRDEDGLPWIQKALDLRPDYAPAHVAKADYHVLRGEYDQALGVLELADVLAPGDEQVLSSIRMAKALSQGPAWAEGAKKKSENYVLDTDFMDHADRMSLHLEAIRARYEEAFGILINPDAKKRVSSVLVFQEAEDYYQYSYLTTGDRKEETGGHFNPGTGQLLLFIDEDLNVPGNLHVLYHEGTHQWCHGNGVELPYWANEGIAEYVGGTLLDDKGNITARAIANSKFLKQRLKTLVGSWDNRLDFFDIMTQNPEEFYSSQGSNGREANPVLKYAQAWTMVHFFMEGGDEKLKNTFIDYLKRFREAKDADTRRGMALQYVYTDTFYNLPTPMSALKARWEVYVKKLCDENGVEFKHEVKLPEEPKDEDEDEEDEDE